jgi:hypothetical protein
LRVESEKMSVSTSYSCDSRVPRVVLIYDQHIHIVPARIVNEYLNRVLHTKIRRIP